MLCTSSRESARKGVGNLTLHSILATRLETTLSMRWEIVYEKIGVLIY